MPTEIIRWTKDEDAILTTYYCTMFTEDLQKLLPHRTQKQIRGRARYLGIKKQKEYKKTPNGRPSGIPRGKYHMSVDCYNYDQSRYKECPKCKNTLSITENNFKRLSNGKIDSICVDCAYKLKSTYGYVTSYNKKYGINIDPNKLIETYDVIQWYKWTAIEKTPNGKFLRNIPKSLITPENVGIISRYVIEEVLNFRTKEELNLFSQKHMDKYKLGFSHTSFVLNNPLNILGLAYPDFVPSKKHKAYDGSMLASKEEVMIYNFVHQKLRITNLEYVGRTWGCRQFMTDNGDNRYVPDFIIKNVNGKDVVIEYFGMYREAEKCHFAQHILNDYRDKTHRKIEYFNNLDDVIFIDLYPEDLEHKFEGVKKKLLPLKEVIIIGG